MAFGYFNEQIAAVIPDKGDNVSFDRLLGLPFWMVALGLATGAGAFLATAVLATVLDWAGAWAGFFDF